MRLPRGPCMHGDRETALRFLDGLPEPVRTSTEAEMA